MTLKSFLNKKRRLDIALINCMLYKLSLNSKQNYIIINGDGPVWASVASHCVPVSKTILLFLNEQTRNILTEAVQNLSKERFKKR